MVHGRVEPASRPIEHNDSEEYAMDDEEQRWTEEDQSGDYRALPRGSAMYSTTAFGNCCHENK
jgi:hypothetical protein